MGIGTLINAFAGNIGTESAPSASTANTSSGNPLETTTTDNIRAGAQGRSLVEQGQDFRDTLHKKISQQEPQAVQDKAKPGTKDSASQDVQTPEQAQLVSAQELLIMAVDTLSPEMIDEKAAVTGGLGDFGSSEMLISNEPGVGAGAPVNQESFDQAFPVGSETVAGD